MKKYIVWILVAVATTGCNTQVSYNESSASQILVVDSFTASKNPITAGETITLSWSVSHPKAVVSIDPGGFKNLKNTGSVKVAPTANTTYTLTATQGKDTVKQSLLVTVSNSTTQRDTLRLAEMRKVQSGLAEYYKVNTGYPVMPSAINLINTTLSSSGWGVSPSGTIFITNVNPNPTPGGCIYTYTSVSPYSYVVTFCLEAPIENFAAGAHILTNAGFQ